MPPPPPITAEEGEGLVKSDSSSTPPPPVPQPTSSSCTPVNVLLFSGLCILLLLVGYLAGKDRGSAALNKYLHEIYDSTASPHYSEQPGEPPKAAATSAPTPAPTKPKFDLAALKQARAKAKETLGMLEAYYGKHADKVLKGDVAFGFGFTGKNSAPDNPTSFNRHVKLIARALVNGESLKLGFIGSSVMCGHDNCYYDSLPAQLERQLEPVFSLAKSKVEMRNACQGGTCGDDYANQVFCFRHMVGDDVDMLFYEWTYFENGDNVIQNHDAIARWAAMLVKGAATIIFNCGGDAWASKELEEKWAPYGSNSINLEEGLKQGVYKGREWGAVGDGLHTTTRYGEAAEPQRKKSLGVVFRNWHAGPLGFQYVSDLSSYMLLRAFIVAVDRIADSAQPEQEWPQLPLDHPVLPEPSFTRKENPLLYDVYTKLEEEPPGCLTVQAKTFGKPIVSVSDKSDDSLNPYKNRVVKLGSSDKAWRLWEKEVNWDMVPKDERALGDMCRPPDHCAYFQPPVDLAAKTPMVFRLPKMVVGLISLCGGDSESGKRLLAKAGSFVAEFDGKVLDAANFAIFPNRKCLAIQQRFTGPLDNKNGHLYLSIVSSDPEFKISQVITA